MEKILIMKRHEIFIKNCYNPFLYVLWMQLIFLDILNNFILELIVVGCIPLVGYLFYIFKKIPLRKENWMVWAFLVYSICSWIVYLFRFFDTNILRDGLLFLILFGVAFLFVLKLLDVNFKIRNKKDKEVDILAPFLLCILINVFQCIDFFE